VRSEEAVRVTAAGFSMRRPAHPLSSSTSRVVPHALTEADMSHTRANEQAPNLPAGSALGSAYTPSASKVLGMGSNFRERFLKSCLCSGFRRLATGDSGKRPGARISRNVLQNLVLALRAEFVYKASHSWGSPAPASE
jgi:hypothetical protein